MRKWAWLFLERIGKLEDEVVSLSFTLCLCKVLSHPLCCIVAPLLSKPQVSFKSRLVKDKLNNCLMTTDGTDFYIQQKGVSKKGSVFGSHKYAGKSTPRYELGINILKGNLA